MVVVIWLCWLVVRGVGVSRLGGGVVLRLVVFPVIGAFVSGGGEVSGEESCGRDDEVCALYCREAGVRGCDRWRPELAEEVDDGGVGCGEGDVGGCAGVE